MLRIKSELSSRLFLCPLTTCKSRINLAPRSFASFAPRLQYTVLKILVLAAFLESAPPRPSHDCHLPLGLK